jgi:outer membrane protein assembly factor BamB
LTSSSGRVARSHGAIGKRLRRIAIGFVAALLVTSAVGVAVPVGGAAHPPSPAETGEGPASLGGTAVSDTGNETATASTASTTVDTQAASDLRPTIESTTAPVTEGEPLTVTVRVDNDNTNERSTGNVTLRVNGTERDRERVNLSIGGTERVDLTWTTTAGDAGNRTVVAETAGSSDSTTATIRDRVQLNLTANTTTADRGEPVGFTVRRSDTGNRTNATVAVNGTTLVTGADGSATYTFGATGTYTPRASKTTTTTAAFRDDETTVDVRLPASAAANLSIEAVDADVGVVAGTPATATVTVRNVDATAGERDVRLFADGRLVASRRVTLNASETTTVTLSAPTTAADAPSVALAARTTVDAAERTTTVYTDDWYARGYGGRRAGFNPVPAAPRLGAAERWNTSLGAGSLTTGPAVVDGSVYTGAADGLYAIDATSGSATRPFAGASGPNVTTELFGPAVANGTLYVGADDGRLYAIDPDTGTIDWQFATGGEVTTAPVVANGTVYVGSADERLYAVDAATGAARWNQSLGLYRPTLAAADGRIVVGARTNVTAVDAATGARLWAVGANTTAVTGTNVTAAPGLAVANGTVYVAGDDTATYAFDAATGAEQWATTTGNSSGSGPAVANGTVYVANESGGLTALAAADGTVGWRGAITATEPFVPADASPAVANGTVYAPASQTLAAFDATSGQRLFRFATDGIVQPPAVANDSVYLTTSSGTAYALGSTGRLSVSIANTTAPVTAGDTLAVTARVVNQGAGEANGTVTLTANGSVVDQQAVTLDGGAATTLELTWPTTASDAGVRTVAVAVGNSETTASVGVREPVGLNVTANASSVAVGEPVAFTVRRTDTNATVNATVSVDGTTLETGPDGIATYTFGAAGTYDATANKAATRTETYGSATTTLEVLQAGQVTLVSGSFDGPFVVDETLRATAQVTNPGEVTATGPVTLSVNGSEQVRESVTLAPGESTVVDLVWLDGFDAAGSYRLAVAADSGTATRTVRARRAVQLNLTADRTTVTADDTVGFTVRTANGTPANATVSIRDAETGASADPVATLTTGSDGAASYTFDVGGEYVATATKSDTLTATFRADDVTLRVRPNVPSFEATLDAPATATPGETVQLSATVTNVGTLEGTDTVELRADGRTLLSEDRTLSVDETTTVSTTYQVGVGDAPAASLSVATGAGVDVRTTTVEVDAWPTAGYGPRKRGYAPAAVGPTANATDAWVTPLGGVVRGAATVTASGDRLYVGTTAGTVAALETDTGEVAWNASVGTVLSAPTVPAAT